MLDEKDKQPVTAESSSNNLVQACYKLTLDQQRLVLLLASTIRQEDEDFKRYEIRVTDFVQMFGLEKRKAIYAELEESSKRLTGKTIELSRDGRKIYASWLSYVEYVEGSGIIKVEFHKSLKPYLLQLSERFTRYRLDTVLKFKSAYSIRLYELLKMEVWKAEKAHQNHFRKAFSLDEYRAILGIPKKAYPIFANFRVRVIQPSVEEVTTQTELKSIDVVYLKTGRKITGILFDVIFEPQAAASKPANPFMMEAEPANESVTAQLVALGFPAELAAFYEYHYDAPRIERNIAYVKAKQHQGLVNDFPAYLNKAIKDDLGKAWEAEQAKQTAEQEQRKLTAQQRELELTLREERSQRENDLRMQQLLKEQGKDTSFDQDELALQLQSLIKVKMQKG